MISKMQCHLLKSGFLIISIILLTGCPWGGVKYFPAEKINAWMNKSNVCFFIPDSKDYQPVFIAINLRSTPSKARSFIDSPELQVADGQLCIPSSYFHLPDTSVDPLIVEFVLQSQAENDHPRSFVSGFSIANGMIKNIPLTKREYDEPEH